MSNAIARNFLLTTLGIATLLPMAGCDTEGPLVLQTSGNAVKAYEVLTEEWTRWALEAPAETNPIADTTGEHCHVGQGDGPWFLAGTFGGSVERECTIPADTPLFFPLVNRWCLPPDSWVEQPGNYEYYVNEWLPGYQSANRAHTCELTLRVDGVELLADTAERDEELYVAITEPFAIGDHSYVGADGHFGLFQPLPPGDHVLELGGKQCYDDGSIAFETAAIYHLHVEGDPEEDEED
jgi:hypothetical protein